MAGYSGTPLGKKLGVKPRHRMAIIGGPEHYLDWLSPLPEGIVVVSRPAPESLDFVHLFAQQGAAFRKDFVRCRNWLKKDGMLWVSWPKKSSGVTTDLDENVIRDFGLKNGLVDVKVCAVDETWSGLKFVYRLKDR